MTAEKLCAVARQTLFIFFFTFPFDVDDFIFISFVVVFAVVSLRLVFGDRATHTGIISGHNENLINMRVEELRF